MWLLTGALIVVVLCWQLEHAWLWISAGAASFVASTAWARHGMPAPHLFTAACDAAVCLMIYQLAKKKWELYLFRIFQASVLVSLSVLASHFWGVAGTKYVYVTMLELLNWLALALILCTGIMQKVGEQNGSVIGGAHPVRNGWSRQALLTRRAAHRAQVPPGKGNEET
jgi:hypothetical protein